MFLRSICACSLVALLVGCGEGVREPLRIALNPWPGYQLIQLAAALGYYEECGVDVEVVEMLSSGEVNRAFERGYVDLACSTLTALFSVGERSDRDPVVFSITDFSNGADVILARDQFKDLPSLKGRKIGADVTALDYVHLAAALRYCAMDTSDVEIVSMRQTDLLDAFARGEIDAGVTYPPVSDELRWRHSDLIPIFDTSLIPGTIIDVILTDRAVLEERKQDLCLFLRAVEKAHGFFHEHREEALAIMGGKLGISGEELANQLDGVKLLTIEEQFEFLSDEDDLDEKLSVIHEMFGYTGELPRARSRFDSQIVAELLN